MADTKRCPMCGKENPANAEICQFCQAQLKPIIGGTAPSETPASMPEGADGVDWLRDFTNDMPAAQEPTTSSDNELPVEDDDFLLNRINLSSVSPDEEEAPKQAPGPESFSLPAAQEEEGNADWLAMIEESSARKEQQNHTLPQNDSDDLDAWLDSLGGEKSGSPAAETDKPPKPKRPRSLTDRLNGNMHKESGNGPKDNDEPTTGANQNTDASAIFTSSSVDRTGSLMQWMDEDTPFSGNDPAADETSSPGFLNDDIPQQATDSQPDLPTEPPETAAPLSKNMDLPDWMQDAAPAPSPVSEPGQGEELPTWLLEDLGEADTAHMSTPTETTGTDSPFNTTSQDEELPTWLLEDTDDTASKPAPTPEAAPLDPFSSAGQDEELPNWLLGDTNDTESTPADAPASADPFSGIGQIGNLPDWESDDTNAKEPATDSGKPEIHSGTTGSLLERLKAEEEAASAFTSDPFSEENATESVFPFGGDLPIEEDKSLEDETLIGSTPPFADIELPDEASPFANISLGNGDDMPDWLSDPDESSETAAETSPALSASPFTEDTTPETASPFDSSLPFAGDTEMPDWLSTDDAPLSADIASTETASPFTSATAFTEDAGSSLFGDESQPLENAPAPFEPAAQTDAEASGEFAHPFADDGLPDWMESEHPIQMLPDQPGEDANEEASQAQLPGWLAAMRPVEAVAADSEGSLDEHVEKSGPLAGLRGVLPADKQTIKYRKPPVYSSKLKVSETQAAHAGLLEDLLQRESKPSDAKRVGLQGSKRLMQLVVAVVLILVLLLFRGAGSLTENPGRPYLSPFTTAFYEQIEDLPDEAPILLAVDYDPGYSGEMKAASSTVIKRLMSKRQRISVISTVPAGPALAEDLLLQTYLSQTASGTDYMNTHTINLGYLPGGVTSLREFTLRPQQAARYGLTTSHDGLLPWDHPALTGVTSLTDFAAVIVITDSVDSGRAWVEQVQPALGSTPMLLISSAQSAPMMEAYVQSGQFSGMISGLAGSVLYENLLGQPGAGHTYWIVLQGGLAVVIALILVGIILELFVTLVANRRTQSEA